MPIYEYKCNGCGGVQEVLHTSMRDVESVKCTDCGSGDLTRLIFDCKRVYGRNVEQRTHLLRQGREVQHAALF